MDVSPLSPPTGSAIPPTGTTTQQAGAVLSSDFETFLQMLTAQAKFQDPLEPIDSSEYAAQLAQFSMVEQQVLSNDLLSALSAQLGTGNMGQMASWIGMEARTTAPVAFDGTPVSVIATPASLADAADLVVRDTHGTEVQRQPVPLPADEVLWAGVQEDGAPFAPGQYSFEVESRSNGTLLSTAPAATYATVTEVRRQGGDTLLILDGGTSVSAADVTALRQPGG